MSSIESGELLSSDSGDTLMYDTKSRASIESLLSAKDTWPADEGSGLGFFWDLCCYTHIYSATTYLPRIILHKQGPFDADKTNIAGHTSCHHYARPASAKAYVS